MGHLTPYGTGGGGGEGIGLKVMAKLEVITRQHFVHFEYFVLCMLWLEKNSLQSSVLCLKVTKIFACEN